MVERRALLLLIPIVLTLAFSVSPYFTSDRGRGWEITVYIIGLACVAAAAVLVVAVLVPRGIVDIAIEQRERLYFYACALLVAELLTIVLLRAWSTYYTHKHGLG